jgi:lipopolysaccharide transport system permease protein
MNKLKLIFKLSARMVKEKYKGSFFGIFWSLLTPLVLLGIYSFVFSSVLGAKWGGGTTNNFALYIFPGILLHQFLLEVLAASSSSLNRYKELVTKVVFPIEVIVPSLVLAAIFQFFMGFILFLTGIFIFSPELVNINYILLPVIILPYIIFALGMGWFFSVIGAFFKDINQMIAIIGTLVLFSSTVFYPLENLPEKYRTILSLNPITTIVDNIRNVTLENGAVNFGALAIYYAVAFVILVCGYITFSRLKKIYPDVI